MQCGGQSGKPYEVNLYKDAQITTGFVQKPVARCQCEYPVQVDLTEIADNPILEAALQKKFHARNGYHYKTDW